MDEWIRYELRAPFYRVNDELKEYLAHQFACEAILLDRHYTSTLAFSYAQSSMKGLDCEGEEFYKTEMAWYCKSRSQQLLTPPDLVCILDIPSKLSLERQPMAGIENSIWGNTACLDIMREYYRLFYSLIEPQVRNVWLDATRPQHIVYEELLNYINQFVSEQRFSSQRDIIQSV